MKVDVTTKIEIDKPIQEVWDFATNPDNAPLWYENIISAVWQSPPPLQIGSLVEFVAKFMGREMRYTYEFKQHAPPNALIMMTSEGPFPMVTEYNFKSLSEHKTEMTLRNHGEPSGFTSIFSGLMSYMMKRANNKDLRSIKRMLES